MNTGNDYAARDSCPCLWITKPEETTYILKILLRLAGVEHVLEQRPLSIIEAAPLNGTAPVNFNVAARKNNTAALTMDVYTGELIKNLEISAKK